MTAAGWVWVAFATVLAALDWAAVAAGSRLLERCAKPAVLLALLAAALTADPRHPGVHVWLVLALCLGLIGDVALSFDPLEHPGGKAEPRVAVSTTAGPEAPATEAPASEALTTEARAAEVLAAEAPRGTHRAASRAEPGTAGPQPSSTLFTAGLASFLVGHLCYCVAMLNRGTERLSLGFGLVLVLLALLAFGPRILAGAQAQGGSPLTIAVVAYIATLGSAVVLGVGTTSLWVAAGIVLFALSDLVLATDRFVVRRGWAPVTVAVAYHLGQALLLIGLVH